jgi:hypothetical protein
MEKPKFGLVTNEDEYLISSSKIKYPVIIDTTTFNQVQNKLATNVTQGDKQNI